MSARKTDADLERDLDAEMPREMSAETVYRALRAKFDRLESRMAELEALLAAAQGKGGSRS